jgi:hypothetical protein
MGLVSVERKMETAYAAESTLGSPCGVVGDKSVVQCIPSHFLWSTVLPPTDCCQR